MQEANRLKRFLGQLAISLVYYVRQSIKFATESIILFIIYDILYLIYI